MAKRQTSRQLGDTLPSGKRQVLTRGNPGNHIRIIVPRRGQWVKTKDRVKTHFTFALFRNFLLSI